VRFCSSFGSPSPLGGMCCMLLPLALWAARYHPRRLFRSVAAVLAVTMLASLVLSQVRNAIAAFLMGMGVTYLYRNRRYLAVAIPCAVLLLGLSLEYSRRALPGSPLYETYVNRSGTLADANGRYAIWREAIRMIGHRPLGGYGYGTTGLIAWSMQLPGVLRLRSTDLSRYQSVLPFLPLDAPEGIRIHNGFLEILLELGAAGLCAVALITCPVVWGLARINPGQLPAPHKELPAFLAGALTAGVANACFEICILSPGGVLFLLFWMIVALSHSVACHAAKSRLAPIPNHWRRQWAAASISSR
jgi:O-antigen ligase